MRTNDNILYRATRTAQIESFYFLFTRQIKKIPAVKYSYIILLQQSTWKWVQIWLLLNISKEEQSKQSHFPVKVMLNTENNMSLMMDMSVTFFVDKDFLVNQPPQTVLYCGSTQSKTQRNKTMLVSLYDQGLTEHWEQVVNDGYCLSHSLYTGKIFVF